MGWWGKWWKPQLRLHRARHERVVGSTLLAEGSPPQLGNLCCRSQGSTDTFPTFQESLLLSSHQTLPMPFKAPPGPAPRNSSGLQAKVPKQTCSTLYDRVLTAQLPFPLHPKTKGGPRLSYPLLGTQVLNKVTRRKSCQDGEEVRRVSKESECH